MDSYGSMLRKSRQQRGRSQLDLATAAGISQRHLSFLEQGRSAPSRQMVARLADQLALPVRQRNFMLVAAGFAPPSPPEEFAAADHGSLAQALDFILAHQEPYPALVVDRQWNILKANEAAGRLAQFLLGKDAPPVRNLADAFAAPDAFRPFVRNWDEVVAHFVGSVDANCASDGSDEAVALLERLLGYRGVRLALRHAGAGGPAVPVLPFHFAKGPHSIRMLATLTSLGTARDLTPHELRIESFFPLDRQSATFFETLHAQEPPGFRGLPELALN